MVPIGTGVRLVNQPYKIGWGESGELYLEAHPPVGEELEAEGWSMTDLTRAFVAATEDRHAQVSWDSAEDVMRAGLGIPLPVSAVPVEALETAALQREAAVEEES
jgi:L,D-transpeptidase ErfK/SrfK